VYFLAMATTKTQAGVDQLLPRGTSCTACINMCCSSTVAVSYICARPTSATLDLLGKQRFFRRRQQPNASDLA